MQNESAHFATTKWILKKGKLYIQANFEIFRNILRAGCHRCVLRFLDLKEKKKIFSLFRAASASSRKTSGLVPSSLCSAGKPVAEPLPLLYRGFFCCCFCPSQHSCQGCKDVSWSSWTDLTPPPARGRSGTFRSKSEIPCRVCFCSLMCVHRHVWIHLQFASVCTPAFHQHQPRLPEYMSCT